MEKRKLRPQGLPRLTCTQTLICAALKHPCGEQRPPAEARGPGLRGGCVSEAQPRPQGGPKPRGKQGPHLIHSGASEVQPAEGAVVAIRHVRPAAEEDQGAGLIGQGSHEHVDEGFLLGTEGGTGWGPCSAGPQAPFPTLPRVLGPPSPRFCVTQKLAGDTPAYPLPALPHPPFPRCLSRCSLIPTLCQAPR